MERVVFKNSRGLNLVGILCLPKILHENANGAGAVAKTPIVIRLHGFGSDKDGTKGYAAKLAEEFCREGIAFFRFDFSGCGESDDDSLTVEKEVDDLLCAIDLIKKRGYEKIGLLGVSLGGLVALECYNKCCKSCCDSCDQSIHNPSIRTMVLWSPVTDKMKYSWNTRYSAGQLAELAETGRITIIKDEGPRRRVIVDKQMLCERESVNQQELLELVKCAVLIIHGDRDKSVPLEDSKNAMKYLPQGSCLEIMNGAGHFLAEEHSRVVQLTKEWFKEKLV